MKVSAFNIILFYVCLNLALYIINETQVLPNYQQSPQEDPSGIATKLVHLDLSGTNLVIGIVTLSVGVIFSYLTGHLIFGGTIAVILFALELFFPIAKWIIAGLPSFLATFGMPDFLVQVINAVMAIVWFWFILGLIAQRPIED